jgi:hypothetical protein
MKNISFLIAFCFSALSFAQNEPTMVAPTPPVRDAADVVAIFTDAYAEVGNTDFNPQWGQSGFGATDAAFDVAGSGNIAIKYDNFNYQGTQFPVQNLTGFEFIHIDIWTPNTGFGFFVINQAPFNDTANFPITAQAGTWQSLDIPLNTYPNVSSVFQLKYDGGDGSANSEFYVDNIYFWKSPADPLEDATLSTIEIGGEPLAGFAALQTDYTVDLVVGTTTPPAITTATAANAGAAVVITDATTVPGTSTIEVTSANGNVVETYTINFVATLPNASPNIGTPDSEALLIYGDNTTITNAVVWDYEFGSNAGYIDLLAGPEVDTAVKLDFSVAGYGEGVQPGDGFDASAYNWLHFDYFADTQSTMLQMILITPGAPNTEIFYQLELNPANPDADGALVQGSWQSVDVPMSFYINEGLDPANVFQYKLGTTSDLVSEIVYFDNIYFSVNQPITLSEESFKTSEFNVYPNPTDEVWNVKSVDTVITSIQVYDITGKQVMNLAPNAMNTRIDSAVLKSGVYLARINAGNTTKTMKLIKM